MLNTTTITKATLEQWVSEKLDINTIRDLLKAKGCNEEEIESQLNTLKKIRYKKRKTTGFILMGMGSFLGFVSCLLTISHAFPGLNDFFLYGLTTIGVCVVFWGMYLVFEG